MILHISKENWRGFINMRQMLDASTGAKNTYHKYSMAIYFTYPFNGRTNRVLFYPINLILSETVMVTNLFPLS